MTTALPEPVKAVMRRWGAQVTRLYDTASPGAGLSVGSEGERAAQRAEAISAVLREVRSGKSPDEAAAIAKAAMRDIAARHNQRRKGDVNWTVWDGVHDLLIDTVAADLRSAQNDARTDALREIYRIADNHEPGPSDTTLADIIAACEEALGEDL